MQLDKPPQPAMKGIQEILEHLGYGEIRLESAAPGAPDWRPIEAAGQLGTTDETKIISRKNSPTCRLVDRETGELVATARKSCPIGSPEEAAAVTEHHGGEQNRLQTAAPHA
jgi:hypothetical protein